jgi:hypothetical protein
MRHDMQYSTLFNELRFRPLGTVLAARKGAFTHFGILVSHGDGGFPTVISNSGKAGRVIEQHLPAFGGGEEVRIVGYPGELSEKAVVQRAVGLLVRRYDPLFYNCEHFANDVHGMVVRSRQVWAVVAVVVGAIALVRYLR